MITANDSANGNWSYGHYDPLNRLVSSSCSSHCPDGANTQGFSYVYDRYGNRTQQNVTAGSGPQPQYSFSASTNHVTSGGYQYDAAGDVTNDGNCSYTWDAEGRMSSATCPANSGATTTYVYDAAGRRVAKEVGGAVTEADVYNTAGQVVSRYGPYPAETWLGDDVWVGGAHLAIYANGQTYFPLTDQVGTERARFASTGGIVETCTSLPFGDDLQCTGSGFRALPVRQARTRCGIRRRSRATPRLQLDTGPLALARPGGRESRLPHRPANVESVRLFRQQPRNGQRSQRTPVRPRRPLLREGRGRL